MTLLTKGPSLMSITHSPSPFIVLHTATLIHRHDTSVGCCMVEAGSWPHDAPSHAYIAGLKELPEADTYALKHAHIYFAHCYKEQGGWRQVLQRFQGKGGSLLDLEFLQDDKGWIHSHCVHGVEN